ncbi:MAG: sulfotransferase [Chromatocurvus sp.]
MTAAGRTEEQQAALEALQADIQQKRFSAALERSREMLTADRVAAPVVWALCGKALEGLQRDDEALSIYLQGLEQFKENARLHLYAGHARTRAGQAQQAVYHFQQALRISPSLLDAYRGLLNFEAVHPDSRDAARILAVALNGSRSEMDRARACFLLGQISVDAGRDDVGFTFYRRANHIVGDGFSAKQRQYTVPASTLAINRRYFSALQGEIQTPESCPAIIIAGLPRSGKSLVESLLATDHSILPGGELAFVRRFVSDLDTSRNIADLADDLRRRAGQSPDGSPLARRYRDFARRARPGDPPRFVTDTSPANLRRIGYLSLLHPEVPIVFCRRNPLDLAVALYFKHFKTGHAYSYSLGTIGKAIARSELLMAHWLRELPNPMATIHYESLSKDPAGALQGLARDLGLDMANGHPIPTAPGDHTSARDSEWRLFTSRSIDSHGSIRPDLIGFGERFQQQMQAAIHAYEEEYANVPRVDV